MSGEITSALNDMADEAKAGRDLAEIIDRWFRDLAYVAPEAVGLSINSLGTQIAAPMRTLGYPKPKGAKK